MGIITKAGESRGRAPGQASDYALRAPKPLDNSTMTRSFIKISGPPNQSRPQVFFPPPLSPALLITQEKYTEVTVNYIMCPHFCFAHVFVIVV